ncbi:MAG: preprotein translocase subunit SecD [Clostridia bacterium]|jgi:preprotein translocase subunit SecD|nr:preprotein translocase subunit SecD [Clostridia bacterium]MDN5323890.1 preprotein translocase subunit SecD [Clostridia bacterium]
MRWEKLILVLITVVIVAGLTFLALEPFQKNVKLGLDLKGGVLVRLEAPENATDEDMDKAIAIIDNRVNGLGVTEPEIRREGNNRILVELPGVENPEEAVSVIGKTALLEFKRVDTLETVITGKDLKDAKEGMNPNEPDPNKVNFVGLELNSEGAKKFAEVTRELIEKYSNDDDPNRAIAIFLDNQLISAPLVQSVISNGQASISGGFSTLEEAHNLAVLLRSGALPVELEIIEKRTVGPKLGQDSLVKSKDAAIYGIAAILVFMLIYYRLPGLVASFSLVLYSLIVWSILIWMKATITLPGIAGFLLSVGMAVDANIIIYERLKEELKNGKSLRAAIDAGFSRAFWTIFDANVTTLIAAAVLIYFGTSSIRGFALTLSIGILASMFTAITFTRFILRQLALSNITRNTKLYGA